MPWGVAAAAVGAAGSIAGAEINKSASSKGASQQSSALNSAGADIQQGYQEAQGYLNPYYQTGAQDEALYNSILTGTPLSSQATYAAGFGGPNSPLSGQIPSNIMAGLQTEANLQKSYNPNDFTASAEQQQIQQFANMTPDEYAVYANRYSNFGGLTQQDWINAANASTAVSPAANQGAFGLAQNIGTSPGGGTSGGQYAAFFNSPDYQFAMQQGLQALDNSASAKGNLLSGAQQIGVTNYAQGLASQQYNSFMSKLAAQASQGQQAGTALANTAVGQGSSLAGIAAQQGNVAAAGTTGGANALTSALSGLGGSYGVGAAGGLSGALSGLFGSSNSIDDASSGLY